MTKWRVGDRRREKKKRESEIKRKKIKKFKLIGKFIVSIRDATEVVPSNLQSLESTVGVFYVRMCSNLYIHIYTYI